MVASLQSRRETLEALLRDKTLELKQICIREAELTGILPPETPIAPGERPPIFSHKVEPRYNTHMKRSLDNGWFQQGSHVSLDSFHAYNSIRRPGRPDYQNGYYGVQSSELKLNNIFKQMHINKPHKSSVHLTSQPAPSGNWNRNQWYRHSLDQIHHNPDSYPNWPKQSVRKAPAISLENYSYATLPRHSRLQLQYESLNRGQRLSHSSNASLNYNRAHSYAVPPSFHHASPQTTAPCNKSTSSTLPATRHRSISMSSPSGLHPRNTALESHPVYQEPDRLYILNNSAKHSSSQSLNLYSIPEKGPSQFSCNSLGRKKREKEWRETSLDTPHLQSSPRTPNIPASASFQSLLSRHRIQSLSTPLQSTSDLTTATFSRRERESVAESAFQYESNVPLESPKNHTVVEVGKWKPYRETTKPFEMSDFYKYSTKFKKNKE